RFAVAAKAAGQSAGDFSRMMLRMLDVRGRNSPGLSSAKTSQKHTATISVKVVVTVAPYMMAPTLLLERETTSSARARMRTPSAPLSVSGTEAIRLIRRESPATSDIAGSRGKFQPTA